MEAWLNLPEIESPDEDVAIIWKINGLEFDMIKDEDTEACLDAYYYEWDTTTKAKETHPNLLAFMMKGYQKKMDSGVFFDEEEKTTVSQYLKSLTTEEIQKIIDDGIQIELRRL